MKLQVLAVFDSKARAYKTPFFVAHVELGLRALADAVNNARDADVYKFPEDFTVWHLGTFDDDTGELQHAPVNLGNCSQFKKERVSGVQSKVA